MFQLLARNHYRLRRTDLSLPSPLNLARCSLQLMADKFQTRFKKVKDAFVKMDLDCTGQISDEEFRFTREFSWQLAALNSHNSQVQAAAIILYPGGSHGGNRRTRQICTILFRDLRHFARLGGFAPVKNPMTLSELLSTCNFTRAC